MKILVIGGTGFIGPHVVRALSQMGHSVSIFHRGSTPAELPAESIFGDRRDLAALRLKADVVVDLILSSGAQAQALMAAFRGASGRVVAASSIDVYRACGVLHGSEEGPLEPVRSPRILRCARSRSRIRPSSFNCCKNSLAGWTASTTRFPWNAPSWATLNSPVRCSACR